MKVNNLRKSAFMLSFGQAEEIIPCRTSAQDVFLNCVYTKKRRLYSEFCRERGLSAAEVISKRKYVT